MSLETFHNLPKHKQTAIIDKGVELFSNASFSDVSTDLITQEAGISKGLLFHYFGSKKNFYLYLLEYAIKLLTENGEPETFENKGFYEILFENMDRKIKLVMEHPNETHFLRFASKEESKQVVKEKQAIMGKYTIAVQKDSARVLSKAIQTLKLKEDIDSPKLIRGLSMYVNTIVMQYLQIYHDCPQNFFDNADQIKMEVKTYIDLMLKGVEVAEK